MCLKCWHFFTLVLWWYEVWFTLYILLSHIWGGSSAHSTFNVPTKLNIIEDLLTSKNNQTWSDVTKINWTSDPVTKCYKTVSDVLVWCWWWCPLALFDGCMTYPGSAPASIYTCRPRPLVTAGVWSKHQEEPALSLTWKLDHPHPHNVAIKYI